MELEPENTISEEQFLQFETQITETDEEDKFVLAVEPDEQESMEVGEGNITAPVTDTGTEQAD